MLSCRPRETIGDEPMSENASEGNICVAEFTIEPFEEGNPGPHVTEALAAVEKTGLEVNMGPFGTSVEGTSRDVLEAVGAALAACLSEGATRVTVTITQPDMSEPLVERHPVLQALLPVLEAVGAEPIAPERLTHLDVPIEWEGEVIGGIRLQSLEGAVRRMVDQITSELDRDLVELSREEKQQVVRALNDRGAFALRGAVEEVADLMGVSRITIYNYLNATRGGSSEAVDVAS